jgi:hypothetical protein
VSDAGCQLCLVNDSTSTIEPAAHEALKVLALRWAYGHGFRSIGFEVYAPSSKFRVDVAAYRSYRRSEKREPTVAVFECKQSRSDLLRDLGQRAKLLERLEDLQRRRTALERLLQVHYPTLRRADTLFPDWDYYDFSMLDHQGYRQIVRKIGLIQRHLCASTKFDTVSRYKLANLHYLVACRGIVCRTEIPIGWGLLETADFETIAETLPAKFFPSANSPWWLDRIARSATSRVMRELGVGSSFL